MKLAYGRRYGACCYLTILDNLKKCKLSAFSVSLSLSLPVFFFLLWLLLSWTDTHYARVIRNPRRQWVTTVPKESLISSPVGSCLIIFRNLVSRTNQENSEGGHSSLIWLCSLFTVLSPGVLAIFVYSWVSKWREVRRSVFLKLTRNLIYNEIF